MREVVLGGAVKFGVCPRCGSEQYEHLRFYAHCVDCNYSNEDAYDRYEEIPVWLQQKRALQESCIAFLETLIPEAAV